MITTRTPIRSLGLSSLTAGLPNAAREPAHATCLPQPAGDTDCSWPVGTSLRGSATQTVPQPIKQLGQLKKVAVLFLDIQNYAVVANKSKA